MDHDICCGVATARGSGGIAIVRFSGDGAETLLRRAFVPRDPKRAFESHRMMYGHVTAADGEVLDEVMAVLMRAPNSYTREDVAEIQCHGGGAAARRVMGRVLSLGARPAEPGEFTRRAFLNGRIDLSEAEAVMQLIGAGSEAAARASVRQLKGGVSGFVRDVSKTLTGVLAAIEACTDYPDEVEEETTAAEVTDTLRGVILEIERRCDPKGARLTREGASIVLAGRPNVGKSSLMNALLRQDRAIVTEIPGTTRDVLTERISLGGISAELSDTAGQRSTLDPVERIGVDRAKDAMARADIVLAVIDASQPLTEEDHALLSGIDERAIVLLNKSDRPKLAEADGLRVSAKTGEGIDTLTGMLTETLRSHVSEDGLTAERHIRLAGECAEHLKNACSAIEAGMPLDVACVDLSAALKSLGEITGEDVTESVLDEIFSKFCVGK